MRHGAIPCSRCGDVFHPGDAYPERRFTFCPLCYAYLRWIKARPVDCGAFVLWVLPADVRELHHAR